jgi:hypothetical protein
MILQSEPETSPKIGIKLGNRVAERTMTFQAQPEPSSKIRVYSNWTHEKLKFNIETSPNRESVDECRLALLLIMPTAPEFRFFTKIIVFPFEF